MAVTVELPYLRLNPSYLTDISKLAAYKVVTYGSWPCDTNGGRVFCRSDGHFLIGLGMPDADGNAMDPELLAKGRRMVVDRVREINSHRIPFYATMTNIVLRPCDNIGEAFCFLDFLADSLPGENGVIVADPRIFDAFKGRYGPRDSSPLKYQLSVIAADAETGISYERGMGECNSVCIKPEDLAPVREGFLRDGWMQRAVSLANRACRRNCPNARHHYRNISTLCKTTPPMTPISEYHEIDRRTCIRNGEQVLSPPDIERQQEAGIRTFKFGRGTLVRQDAQRLFPELGRFLRDLE